MNNKYHVEKLGKCWLKDVGNDASNITTSVADKAISINIVVILWQKLGESLFKDIGESSLDWLCFIATLFST